MGTDNSLLLSLPFELRDAILRHVFDGMGDRRFNLADSHNVHEKIVTPPIRILPPICLVSRQLYFEATPHYLNRVMLISYDVDTTCWIRRWLATFPADSGFRGIRQLAFRSFHGPEQMKGYELISLCPNIRYLDIMFGDEYAEPGNVPSLDIKSLGASINAYESLETILLIHQLHKLLTVPKLERFMFGFHDWVELVSVYRAGQVQEWLQMKFVEEGKAVRVSCRQNIGL